LKTYGRILSLTRKSIINDDLGAFSRVPQAFGASAARLESDLVYSLLTSNPSMSDGVALFHDDHSNLELGAALSVSSLASARKAMRTQKGIAGQGFLNIVPKFLIVPANLESTALMLIANEHIERVSGDDTTRSGLPWVKDLEVVVDPRLDADSEMAWYLAGSPLQIDTIEIAHLAGNRGVFTEEDVEFASDNLQVKARLDFATQVIDWCGLVKNPGA
jgi:phage major head subunit gpT-like protein